MKRRLSFMAAILIFGLLFTTCDLLKEAVKKPEVSLKSVDFSEISFDGLTLLSKVDVRNDNSIDIPLPKIDWDLLVIDNPFVKGIIQSEGSLKSQDSTEVQFPVSFDYTTLLQTIISLTDENTRRDAGYKMNMMVHIPVPELGDLSWPLKHEGKIPIMEIPEIKMATAPKFTLTNSNILNPTGNIAFALSMKNKSNVAVALKSLSVALKINNKELPSGGLTSQRSIGTGSTDTLNFSFPLSAADITNIGLNVLSGSFNYSLTGNYKLGIPDFPLLNDVEGVLPLLSN